MTDEIVSDAASGIDMMASLRSQRNEALEAFDSLHKAKVMYLNESQLKQIAELAKTKKQQTLDLLDEFVAGPSNRPIFPSIAVSQAAAAITGAIILEEDSSFREKLRKRDPLEMKTAKTKAEPTMDYTIKCDFSMLPSEDPDVYTPLEIVSYIGMIKSVGVADPIQMSN